METDSGSSIIWETILGELDGTFSVVPPEISAIRLLAAVLFGGIVGFEREAQGKPAGLRTHMLVSMAAALFIVVSQQLSALPFGTSEAVQIDPLRLIEAVTAGVAFLAAGIIFSSGGKVHNITTGASLWLAGAVGLACGSGQVPLAALATGIVVIVLFALRHLDRWIAPK
ncbi:MgtC/SapB family protein [Poseidonocella sedimentorum]|uniref:Protein MgtC n=1 Tax=Poseidonocella sedimentorum TaxID=871652 RepID=A0A1I6EGV4_9RHOB|nr:MgtC/SapB family protein [Poseidonocella sedimentorum]SFR16999.1 putative Mg2+ transporter-C (MgtC) family protein [Poseidonocella sedimentorum]